MKKPINKAAILTEAGLKVTELRLRALEVLVAADAALSHAELCEVLSDMDRVSLYRNLKAFTQSGLAHTIKGTDGILRYVLNRAGAHSCPGGHPHFLCQGCGRVFCLHTQKLPHVRVPAGSAVRGKQYLVYGLCPACADRGQA